MQGIWENLYGGLRGLFWYIVKWVVGYGSSLLGSAMDYFASYLPDSIGSYVGALVPYVEAVNAWVPIDYGILLLVSYYMCSLAVWTVRHIIKLIPGLG